MKEKAYRRCIRLALRYSSETWCIRENEKAILWRTERAMVRAMCGWKVAVKKIAQE